MAKATIIITLEIEADDVDAVGSAVDEALDAGEIQAAITEAAEICEAGELTITSALCEVHGG